MSEELDFVSLGSFLDPQQVERLSEQLRDTGIPHRTEWRQSVLVPADWADQARALAAALPTTAVESPAATPPHAGGEATREAEVTGPEVSEDEGADEAGEDEGPLFGRESIFDRESTPPTADELTVRPVWPAYALAALPGLGLGHLYAGKHQLFFYLLFASILGGVFFKLTGSYLSFLMNALAWSADLGFASMHVREHNRRAERLRLSAAAQEQEFLDSLAE